jgi:hypothetical protein
MCECCNDESGGTDVGVACIPCGPMSIMWCNNCLQHKPIVIPSFAVEYLYIFVAGGNLDNLADEVKEWYTWADGKYMPMNEYVKRITLEQVEKELKEYYETNS